MTTASKRRRGFLASREGLAILEEKRLKKGFTHETLTEAAKLNSDDQVRRLFNPHWGKGIQRDAIEKIAAVLELQPTEFIEDWLPKCRSSKQKQTVMNSNNINWREICLVMLEQQKKEQRVRRKATEQGFELKVYVPLGLVERKEQQRRTGILPMDLVHQLKEEVITCIYQHDEFLNDVIGQQTVGKNKHIAIVGEPGAGKTTLLDNIATYIQKNTEDLPICISLASLQGRVLKNYILEEWLPEAISLTYPDIDVETFHETSLQKRLRQGGVWLLLDGVDEMGETNTLEKIQSQLSDWLGKVRVVLTCRTNVWDAKTNNPLTGFDTYKTQNFNQGDVRRFIKQWFGFARKPQLGKVLREKLNEPQSDRIRQLVENPLRLALLCQVFYRDEKAELPETKAGLYELFVRYFYEWKPTLSSVDWTTQLELKEELHQALGRLSIAGLDSDARFRLPESLIKKELDDRLFKLAWELGWLNLVDREAKTDEPVYAFFHPTFQEYFAALAIYDRGFFLPDEHEDKPVIDKNKPEKDKSYRIFESYWREVFLLWLGLEKKDTLNKEILNNEKEKLINKLLLFNDGCDNFYEYQAIILASTAIEEFKNYAYADTVLNYLFSLAFDTYYELHLYPISELALKTIKNMDHHKATTKLVEFIEYCDPDAEDILILAIETLEEIGVGNQQAIQALKQIIENIENSDIEKIATDCLKKISLANQFATTKIKFVKTDENDDLGLFSTNIDDLLNRQNINNVVTAYKERLLNNDDNDDINFCYEVIWHCAQNMSYPDFYRAWHNLSPSTNTEAPDNIPVGKSSITQNLNFTQLPSILDSAIAKDEELNKAVKLICIDGSYFSDPNNPATDIYIEMVEQGCPEKQEELNTMQQLKKYWRLDLRKLEKRAALLFYNSKSDRTLNPCFLSDISTFGGTIGIISDENCNNVRRISPHDPNLIDTVLKWLRREIAEFLEL